MSFPAYEDYKDSGVGWLGEIPSGWDVVALKYIVSLKSGDGITGESIEETGEYPVYGGNGLRGYTNDCTHDGHYVVVDRQGALCGNINYANGRFWASEHAVVASPLKPVDTIWLGEMLRAMNLNQYSVSAAQPGLSMELVGNLRTALPPDDEQKGISSFLDVETSMIDALVSEQRRLIELLKKKRQAVISHAVTKGLNPGVPMKPSGIGWLGDVSEHWEVVPVKHLCSLLKDGTHLPPQRVDDGVPLLCVRNLVDGEFVLRDDDSMISQGSYEDLCRAFVPAAGDVLLAIVGATLGKTAVIPSGLGDFHIQRSVGIFRTQPNRLASMFLNLIFRSSQFQSKLWELVGYSAQPGIYLGTLQNVRVPVPPEKEQADIVEIATESSERLSELLAEAQRAIELLGDRRTAIISEAVTGEIDVQKFASGERQGASRRSSSMEPSQ